MSTRLFQRRVNLILVPPTPGTLQAPPVSQGTLIESLRVQFTVTKTITKEPNTADIRVSNLAESSRSQLQGQGWRIILFAGYANPAQVFTGNSRTIDHVHEGSDWVTKIQCGDGERNYQFATVSTSFAPGTPIRTALTQAVKAMAVDPGNSQQAFSNIVGQFVSGYAMHGKATAELDSVLAGQGLEWSIQDGRLQILAPNTTTNEGAVLVNEQSGLVGSPEHGTPTKIGGPGVLRVKSMLNPLIRPGRQIKVESQFVNGYFGVQKVVHTGDTCGGDWYSTAEAWAV